MPEDYEKFISLTLRIWSSRKPSRTRVRSWKHQWLLLCPVKLRKIVGVVDPTKLNTKLACILDADESTRMRMGNSIPHHHQDHIAGKGDNSLQHYNLVHKFIPMPQAMKIPAAKAAVDKEWEKLEKILAWNLTKVRSKKEVIDEARASGAKVQWTYVTGTWMEKEKNQMHGPVSQGSMFGMGGHRKQTTSRPDKRKEKCGNTCPMHPNVKISENGLSKNRSLTMLEGCELFTSLIQRMRILKLTLKNDRRKFEIPIKLLCAEVAGKLTAVLGKTKTQYSCIVEADESNVWMELLTDIMKITSKEKA